MIMYGSVSYTHGLGAKESSQWVATFVYYVGGSRRWQANRAHIEFSYIWWYKTYSRIPVSSKTRSHPYLAQPAGRSASKANQAPGRWPLFPTSALCVAVWWSSILSYSFIFNLKQDHWLDWRLSTYCINYINILSISVCSGLSVTVRVSAEWFYPWVVHWTGLTQWSGLSGLPASLHDWMNKSMVLALP